MNPHMMQLARSQASESYDSDSDDEDCTPAYASALSFQPSLQPNAGNYVRQLVPADHLEVHPTRVPSRQPSPQLGPGVHQLHPGNNQAMRAPRVDRIPDGRDYRRRDDVDEIVTHGALALQQGQLDHRRRGIQRILIDRRRLAERDGSENPVIVPQPRDDRTLDFEHVVSPASDDSERRYDAHHAVVFPRGTRWRYERLQPGSDVVQAMEALQALQLNRSAAGGNTQAPQVNVVNVNIRYEAARANQVPVVPVVPVVPLAPVVPAPVIPGPVIPASPSGYFFPAPPPGAYRGPAW